MADNNTSNNKVTVLIVEDSPTQSAILTHFLENHGYLVIASRNGKEALAILKQQKPDLIISDVTMPEMNGLSLCCEVKKDKSLQGIPFILMTALDGIEEIVKCLESGADNFVSKPFDQESLLARMTSMLNTNRLSANEKLVNGHAIDVGGKTYVINPNQENILRLLMSSFEDAVTINKKLKAREEELQRAKEEADLATLKKSRFLAAMSHEIRTPMVSILGLLELLNLSHLDADQQSTLLTITESSKSLLRIIDDILDFSNIEAGKMEVLPQVGSIQGALKKLYRIYSSQASQRGLALKFIADSTLTPAHCFDELRLQQLLGNFLSNAIKFTKDGAIEMKAELIARKGNIESIRFSVKDTGIGVSPENQLRVFQPFVQVHERENPDFSGTGLGLAICQRLAQLMGGVVEMKSELGQGTTMTLTLTLPISDPTTLAQATGNESKQLLADALVNRRVAPSITVAQRENTLVLVVDDHSINRKLLIRQLNILGYAAEGAEDGFEALTLLGSKRYGLVITDCDMPGMSGEELARKIRSNEVHDNSQHIPIIACTANVQKDYKEQCLKAGMDDFLLKPVALHDLMKALDHCLPISESIPIDYDMLIDIVGDNDEAIHEILMDFKRTNDTDAKLLTKALRDNDFSLIMNLSHRMKGACQLIGAKGLASVCLHLEEASRAKDGEKIGDYVDQFKQEADNLSAYLDVL